MCRLLGIVANKPVDFKFSFVRFRPLAEYNPDGWGIGWYDRNGTVKIQKESGSALESSMYKELYHKITSHLIIEHVRFASCGKVCIENSHPFKYHNWLFAHNGTIHESDSLSETLSDEFKDAIQGKTDSEVYFHFILHNINKNDGDVIKGIKSAVSFIKDNLDYYGLNFLLSNGEELFAYREGNSLFYLERNPQNMHEFTSLSRETQVFLSSKKINHEKAVVVCSEKITDENDWIEINEGCLLSIDAQLEIQKFMID